MKLRVFCKYHPSAGWQAVKVQRALACAPRADQPVRVEDGLLRLTTHQPVRAGWFVNPAKLLFPDAK
jgi:hypothetical protein